MTLVHPRRYCGWFDGHADGDAPDCVSLYGVTTRDPATFQGAAFVLVSIALAASHVPARRAMTVDLLVVLAPSERRRSILGRDAVEGARGSHFERGQLVDDDRGHAEISWRVATNAARDRRGRVVEQGNDGVRVDESTPADASL
jgi:hypothetical protein